MIDVWMHHIVSDEWSMGIIASELVRVQADRQTSLGGVGQLWEFAEWEWEMLESEGPSMATWWRQHLKGCTATSATMAMVNNKDGKQRLLGRQMGRRIGQATQARAQQAAAEAGVSLFAVWQGVFAVWCWRNTTTDSRDKDQKEQQQESDISNDEAVVLVVGPYGRRDQARFQQTVGYLLNMVVYKYDARRMSEMELSEMGRESGRVIGQAIERGGNYPFSRLVRESGVKEAERLMDVMFVWTTGQELQVGTSEEQEVKNVLSAMCDGQTMVCEAASGWMEEWQMSEMGWWMTQRAAGKAGLEASAVAVARAMGATMSVERIMQEEEWGTGPTVVGAMPATFQAVVSKYMKTKHESKMVDLSGVTRGAKAGDVVGLHMRRSEMLVWLTYSVVAHGFAFLPLDDRFVLEVVELTLGRFESSCCCFGLESSCKVSWYLRRVVGCKHDSFVVLSVC